MLPDNASYHAIGQLNLSNLCYQINQDNEPGAGWSGSAPLAAATSASSASMICVLALVTWGGVQV
jgi:hypothetical protein